MFKLFSDESMNFMTKGSPLAIDLIRTFQAAIDKRESISTTTNRIIEVKKYANTVMVPAIKTIIKKHTGITCTNVRLSKRIDFGYACLMNFGDKYGLTAHDVINRYSGLDTNYMIIEYMRQNGISPQSAADMQKIAESLSRDTGIFSVTKLPNKVDCTMVMYFDPYSAFLAKECGHDKCDYFTAEEITAVVLHEIGHMFTALAHSADKCFRSLVYNRSMEYFLQNATIPEKVKLAKNGINKLDPKEAAKVSSALDQCTAVDNSTNNGTWVGDAFNAFLTMFIYPFMLAGAAIYLLFDTMGAVFSECITNWNWNSVKNSDFADLPKQLKLCEQFADEFVSKHGLSHAQASALRKLWDYQAWSSGTFVVGNRLSALSYTVNKTLFYVTTLIYGDCSGGDNTNYDNRTERATRLLYETAKAFKNKDVSPEMVDFFIEDYEKTKLELTKNKSTLHKVGDFSETIINIRHYLISALPAMLISGRFSDEYKKLYGRVEQLMSNPLFYRAAKLERLLKK